MGVAYQLSYLALVSCRSNLAALKPLSKFCLIETPVSTVKTQKLLFNLGKVFDNGLKSNAFVTHEPCLHETITRSRFLSGLRPCNTGGPSYTLSRIWVPFSHVNVHLCGEKQLMHIIDVEKVSNLCYCYTCLWLPCHAYLTSVTVIDWVPQCWSHLTWHELL